LGLWGKLFNEISRGAGDLSQRPLLDDAATTVDCVTTTMLMAAHSASGNRNARVMARDTVATTASYTKSFARVDLGGPCWCPRLAPVSGGAAAAKG
jgi:hypothetical protein